MPSYSKLKNGQKNNHKIAYINARLINPRTKENYIGEIITEGKEIFDIGKNLSKQYDLQEVCQEIIDCKGKLLMPGIVDLHVHFREPGQEHKETIESGSKSAAKGGVTTVVCQPNTNPPIDNTVILGYIKYKANESAYVNIESYASVTTCNNNLTEMELLYEEGALGFTDDGLPISNSFLMKQALKYSEKLKVPIAQHAEDLLLSNGGCINEGKISSKLSVRGISNISESVIVARDLLLLDVVGGHYHILHISTKEALELVKKAKEQGLNVTCEVTPHHFTLNEQEVLNYNTYAKMNPPLRSEEDRLAMVEGLKSGLIDCIATDHAPHEIEAKNTSLETAAFGIVGLETILPLSLELYHTKKMSLMDVISNLTYKPAKIINKHNIGILEKGASADLVLVDLDHEWVIDVNKFESKSKNSPFNGRKVKGKVLRTVVWGKTVYSE
ncbi:MAG: dihydroorotase [Rickettsiaceae bacterium H1]|nr:dihydroorotase [Rickettsiaceae bacterium H1]